MLNLSNANVHCHLNGHVPCRLSDDLMSPLINIPCRVPYILSNVAKLYVTSRFLKNGHVALSNSGVEGHLSLAPMHPIINPSFIMSPCNPSQPFHSIPHSPFSSPCLLSVTAFNMQHLVKWPLLSHSLYHLGMSLFGLFLYCLLS